MFGIAVIIHDIVCYKYQGIYNGLRNIGRNNSLAVTHEDVMKVYIHIFIEMIERKQKSFERRLGCKSMDNLLEQLRFQVEMIRVRDQEQQNQNTAQLVKPKKKPYFTKKIILTALKEIAVTHLETIKSDTSNDLHESQPDSNKFLVLVHPPTLELMMDLMQSSGIVISIDSSSNSEMGISTDTPKRSTPVDTGVVDVTSDSEEDSDKDDNPDEPSSKGFGRARVPSIWNWQKDLLDIMKNISGLEKLRATPKPSTAAIGNWAVLECIKKISEFSSIGSGFDGRLFMGKKVSSKQRIDFPLTKNDSVETISMQWDNLR